MVGGLEREGLDVAVETRLEGAEATVAAAGTTLKVAELRLLEA